MIAFTLQDGIIVEPAPIYATTINHFKRDSRTALRDHHIRAFLSSKFGTGIIIAILPFYVLCKRATRTPLIGLTLALALPLAAHSFA